MAIRACRMWRGRCCRCSQIRSSRSRRRLQGWSGSCWPGTRVQLGRVRARACARYGVLVVGEEMKGLVNCNFLPGSARRLELGTVSAEPLSRAYWSQKLRLGETVGLSRARTSGESPDSTQAGRGPQWPIQLAAISAHPAAMVGTASTLYRLDGREQISAATGCLLCGGFLPRKRDLHMGTSKNPSREVRANLTR